jgi:hypothetical protein
MTTKLILSWLNLEDGERLNLTHVFAIGSFLSFIGDPHLYSCIGMGISFTLMAVKMYLCPVKKPTHQTDVEDVKIKAQQAIEEIKRLNLKLGFR